MKHFQHDSEIAEMLSQGYSVAHIARTLGASRQMVYAARKRLGLDQDARRRDPGGSGESSQVPSSLDAQGQVDAPDAQPGEVTKGLAVWWSIALDTTAPPAARVNAVDKLREIGAWDQILSRQETTLPPPLNAQDLIERASDLLESLPRDVLEAVLGRVPSELLLAAARKPRSSVAAAPASEPQGPSE